MPNECYDWSIITYKKCATSLTNWWTCYTKKKKKPDLNAKSFEKKKHQQNTQYMY